ncbi:MAG: hypothetical protein E7519_15950 [Ruminococcaceae bacterium]|nr:hypothetical protein [Oscillospiraceae bacterium]
MSEIIEQARQKLADEVKKFQGGQKERVIYKEVAETLQSFCSEEWFAQSVMDSKKTLSDCCKTVLSDISDGGISDLEVYKRAVEFYVPGSTVKCQLSVCRNWDEAREPAGGSVISLLDLL